MQFTTVIVALFAAVAMAAPAPAAEPVAAPVAQSTFCTECKDGGRSCCSLTACYVYKC